MGRASSEQQVVCQVEMREGTVHMPIAGDTYSSLLLRINEREANKEDKASGRESMTLLVIMK